MLMRRRQAGKYHTSRSTGSFAVSACFRTIVSTQENGNGAGEIARQRRT